MNHSRIPEQGICGLIGPFASSRKRRQAHTSTRERHSAPQTAPRDDLPVAARTARSHRRRRYIRRPRSSMATTLVPAAWSRTRRPRSPRCPLPHRSRGSTPGQGPYATAGRHSTIIKYPGRHRIPPGPDHASVRGRAGRTSGALAARPGPATRTQPPADHSSSTCGLWLTGSAAPEGDLVSWPASTRRWPGGSPPRR